MKKWNTTHVPTNGLSMLSSQEGWTEKPILKAYTPKLKNQYLSCAHTQTHIQQSKLEQTNRLQENLVQFRTPAVSCVDLRPTNGNRFELDWRGANELPSGSANCSIYSGDSRRRQSSSTFHTQVWKSTSLTLPQTQLELEFLGRPGCKL